MAGSSSVAVGGRQVLRLHQHRKQWRGRSGTVDRDFTAEFLFGLAPEGGGAAPELGWCEVQIRDNLLERPGWAALKPDGLVKALYSYAVDCIRASGRVARHLSMSWSPGKPWAEGPCWDLSQVDLRRPPPVAIDPESAVLPIVVEQH